jgi:hypothetical protein
MMIIFGFFFPFLFFFTVWKMEKGGGEISKRPGTIFPSIIHYYYGKTIDGRKRGTKGDVTAN